MDYVVHTPYPQDVSRCLEQSPEVQVMATPLLTPLYPSHCLASLAEVPPAQAFAPTLPASWVTLSLTLSSLASKVHPEVPQISHGSGFIGKSVLFLP